MSLLVAAVFCYFIFLAKNSMQKKDIEEKVAALATVGTDRQKEHENEVVKYQKKINDFSSLLENHEFASQVFYFMQQQTMPNVWFKNFNMDAKRAEVSFSGEAESNDAFSRQIAAFEKNEYVKSINVLNSTMGDSAKQEFNLAIVLDQKIFKYITNLGEILKTTTPSNQ